MSRKKILVFGGSGFIGSHVADQLSETGNEVTIFDQKKSKWLRQDQKFIYGDISDANILDKAIKNSDIVYNFAAIADLNEAITKPIETININILSNALILEGCVKHNIERFIYASSVYVNSREGGFYRCSKHAAESYIEEYKKSYGLEYTILRYGSLYGPRSDESNGLYKIIKNALKSKKIQYQGNTKSMREYIHVQDAAIASVDILNPKYAGKTIVLTGQEAMFVSDVLEMIAEILGYNYDAIEFLNSFNSSHYSKTSYAYEPRLGLKYIPPLHVDLGQGILQLIEEIQENED